MKTRRSRQFGLLSGLLALAAALIASLDMIGKPARLVHVLTVFAGGMGAGVSLARIAFEARMRKRTAAGDSVGEELSAPLDDC